MPQQPEPHQIDPIELIPHLVSLRRAAKRIDVPGPVLREELEKRKLRIYRIGRRLLVDTRDLVSLLDTFRAPTPKQARDRTDLIRYRVVLETDGEAEAEAWWARIMKRRRNKEARERGEDPG